jgi:hypothetical protein
MCKGLIRKSQAFFIYVMVLLPLDFESISAAQKLLKNT